MRPFADKVISVSIGECMNNNKKKYYTIAVILVLSFAQVILFQNCGRDYGINVSNAVEDLGGVTGTVPVCDTTFIEENGVIKILFLVDTSGSNSMQSGATDPQKYWRSNVINSFRDHYASKENFFYNITTFHADTATSLVNFQVNGQTRYFTNATDKTNTAVTSFVTTNDSGNTPYKKATDKVQQIIESDLATGADVGKYLVVMLSDGMPNPARSNAEVTADVQAVIALAPDKISFNTIYYYNSSFSNEAQDRLSTMAAAGNGNFIVANSNEVLAIDDVIRIPHEECH